MLTLQGRSSTQVRFDCHDFDWANQRKVTLIILLYKLYKTQKSNAAEISTGGQMPAIYLT